MWRLPENKYISRNENKVEGIKKNSSTLISIVDLMRHSVLCAQSTSKAP
jgi:hypothetical protein